MRDPERQRGPIVHPTAVVHPSARLDDGVEVGPYAVVEANVVVGSGTTIGPHCVLHDHVVLGRNNRLAAHVVLGGRPQDRGYHGERTPVMIGDDNLFSEFVSVDRATGEEHETRIGNGTYIMSSSKISHNCVIGDGALIVTQVALGGWVHVGDHAYVGGVSGIHQFTRVGRLVMVAGHSGVAQDVPPYLMVAGFRARAVGLNTVGLQRHGVAPADRRALRRAFHSFYLSGLSMDAAVAAVESEAADSAPVREFLAFIREARQRNRGIVRWQRETAS
jgi:UDP-N-acetylglucosamine acyltransferase